MLSTVLYYTECIVQFQTVVPDNALRRTALHCTSLPCPALQCVQYQGEKVQSLLGISVIHLAMVLPLSYNAVQ